MSLNKKQNKSIDTTSISNRIIWRIQEISRLEVSELEGPGALWDDLTRHLQGLARLLLSLGRDHLEHCKDIDKDNYKYNVKDNDKDIYKGNDKHYDKDNDLLYWP